MKILTAIASTTHVDLHGERMSKSVLDRFAQKMCEEFVPLLVNHDPNKQIGVLLYGKVVVTTDGEFALHTVSGVFDNPQEAEKYRIGSPNKVLKKYTHYLSKIEDVEKLSAIGLKDQKNGDGTPEPSISTLLERHLDSTQVYEDGSVIKVKRYIASVGDLKIEVYPKDHKPEHFHVVSKPRGINARFDINTLEHVSTKNGQISKDDIKKIQNFFMTVPGSLDKLRNEHQRLTDS